MTDRNSPSDVSRRAVVAAAGSLALAGAAHGAPAQKTQAPQARRFAGKVALITGGARGIGRAIAERLAADGADVAICDILEPIASMPYPMASRVDLDETLRAVEATGQRSLGIKADVRRPNDMASTVARVGRELGPVDFLVANAGIMALSPVSDLSDRLFDDVLRTNLYGVFHSVRAVLPVMTERKYGRIVAIASQAGRMGHATLSHYCASKWGVIGLVKATALEVAAQGVTVNAVCPGGVNTVLNNNEATWRRALPDDPAPTREKYVALRQTQNLLPQGVPWLEPQDIADVVAFLMTDDAGHITGSAIDVSAGRAASFSA